MPDTNPPPAALDGLHQIQTNLAADFATPEATAATLVFINTFINAAIGLLITIAVVAFFMYLISWVIAQPDSELQKTSIRGATRSLMALFLMINIWSIVRILQALMGLSGVILYAVFFLAFLLLGFWSLFSLGDGFVRLISYVANYCVDAVAALLRRYISRFQGLSTDAARFTALLVLVVLLTLATFTSISGGSGAGSQSSNADRSNTYALPLQHEPGDATLNGRTYSNSRYGIDITYPSGWVVTQGTTTDELVESRNDTLGVYSRLNAGMFPDLASNTREAYLTALWRVEKNIHQHYATESAGVLSADTTDYGQIASSSASVLAIRSFWILSDGSIGTYFDDYLIFGNGPVYFTLQFQTLDTGTLNSKAMTNAFNDIVSSIHLH
jgi:hypothetical protein